MGIAFGYLLRWFLRRDGDHGPLDQATGSYRVRSWSGWAIILPMLIVAVLAGWIIMDIVT